MRIYHTCASRNDVETARSAAPSYEHGFGWLPSKMCRFDEPYFLDNGAYSRQWDAEDFLGRLTQLEDRMPRRPGFVVLPDIYQEGGRSLARSARWAGAVDSFGVDYYLPVQNGMSVGVGVEAALELDAAGIFIGGSEAFKREYANRFALAAHDYGLRAHLGKPGERLSWARDLGVDSVDTASIVRNGYWHRLRKLEATKPTEETTLDEVTA